MFTFYIFYLKSKERKTGNKMPFQAQQLGWTRGSCVRGGDPGAVLSTATSPCAAAEPGPPWAVGIWPPHAPVGQGRVGLPGSHGQCRAFSAGAHRGSVLSLWSRPAFREQEKQNWFGGVLSAWMQDATVPSATERCLAGLPGCVPKTHLFRPPEAQEDRRCAVGSVADVFIALRGM